jgi:hypothetical protein
MRRFTPRRSAFVVLAVSLALLLDVRAAAAETPREQAIALADEGSKRFENKDYAGAVEKFDAAFALVPVPVFALQSASALEMSGRLVDALARYRAVDEMKPDASWSTIQHEAQTSARQRYQRLAARTPRLIVGFGGARADRVELDGKQVTPEALASGMLVDPGEHRVVAHAGPKSAEQLVALAEGQTRRIELNLPVGEDSATRTVSNEARATADTGAQATTEPRTSSTRTVGWAALGVGAAGIVVGSVTGFIALGKRSDLDERCPERSCPQAAWEDNDSYDRMRTISTIGFVVGGIGIATGGVLLWTSPSASSAGRARLRLRAAPGRVSFAGEF